MSFCKIAGKRSGNIWLFTSKWLASFILSDYLSLVFACWQLYLNCSVLNIEHSSHYVVILLKIQRPHNSAGSLWLSIDGMLLYSGIAVILNPGRVFKHGWCQGRLQWWESELCKWGKSRQIGVLSRTARITKCTSPHKQVSRSWTKTVVEEKKIEYCALLKFLCQDSQLFISNNPACRVAKDLMWYRKTFTHFHHIMHLTLDPHKRRAEHQSPSVHSPLHSGPYCKCSCP